MSDNSNSKNMSLEERLVQYMKGDSLAAVIEEDDLIAIASKTIKETFFEPRYDTSGYRTKELPSIAKEVAQKAAESEAKRLLAAMTDELIKSDEFQKMLMEVFPIAIQRAIVDAAVGAVNMNELTSRWDLIQSEELAEKIRNIVPTVDRDFASYQ